MSLAGTALHLLHGGAVQRTNTIGTATIHLGPARFHVGGRQDGAGVPYPWAGRIAVVRYPVGVGR